MVKIFNIYYGLGIVYIELIREFGINFLVFGLWGGLGDLGWDWGG